MHDLFADFGATDEMYRHIAEEPTPQSRTARAYANELWHRTSPYLGRDLERRLTQQFHQAFWEMYLADIVLDVGLDLRRREERRFASRGPDLQIGGVTAWIEAVADHTQRN